MTTNHTEDMTAEEQDRIIERGLEYVNKVREQVKQIEQARDDQPARLAQARAAADEARGWALIEEPWDDHVTAIPAHNALGGRTGGSLAIPDITAKEMFGSRLCFDILDCGDDDDALNEVIARYFTMVHGDTGLAFLLFSSALTTVASLVVPQLLEEIEQQASNYDTRVALAEARAKAWHGRVGDLRGAQDDAADCGVNPVDGFDIGANALDPDGGR